MCQPQEVQRKAYTDSRNLCKLAAPLLTKQLLHDQQMHHQHCKICQSRRNPITPVATPAPVTLVSCGITLDAMKRGSGRGSFALCVSKSPQVYSRTAFLSTLIHWMRSSWIVTSSVALRTLSNLEKQQTECDYCTAADSNSGNSKRPSTTPWAHTHTHTHTQNHSRHTRSQLATAPPIPSAQPNRYFQRTLETEQPCSQPS